MKISSFKLGVYAFALVWIVASCSSSKEGTSTPSKGINLFSLEQDIALGKQVAEEIDNNKKEYPTLDSVKYKDAYAYLYKVRNNILNSGNVDLKDKLQWRLRIIQNDSVLNAFCTPGGYIYVYTGILKYLESEDQLAGVLGHEIAHADMRHSTRQMTTMYGIQILLDVLAGDRNALKQITGAVIGLKFSRKHETEADERSVHYLCPTSYNAAGGASFFEKIQAAGGARQPEFLSTHPDPGNRIENYYNSKTVKGCAGDKKYQAEYKAMVAKLPK